MVKLKKFSNTIPKPKPDDDACAKGSDLQEEEQEEAEEQSGEEEDAESGSE